MTRWYKNWDCHFSLRKIKSKVQRKILISSDERSSLVCTENDLIHFSASITKNSKYKRPVYRFCDWLVNSAPRTRQGMVFISKWGSNRHAANSAFICLVAGKHLGRTDYQEFAKQQINLLLGDAGRSFVVGFGVNPPTQVWWNSCYWLLKINVYVTFICI